MDNTEHLLPNTDAGTSLQKFQRAFAQEFLCPWELLQQFFQEHGASDDAIAAAAEKFNVSQRVVETTGVNKRVLSRDRLA